MIESAIILSGGEGKRLRPYTDDKPKPMIVVGDRPIVGYQVRQLVATGVKKIVFACSYRREVLQEYFGNGSKFGFEAAYSVETTPLGTGGAIKKAMRLLPEGWAEVFVTNGDNLWKLDLSAMAQKHKQRKAWATDFLTQLRSPYGLGEVDRHDQIEGFREKPLLPYWLNGGVYVLSREIELLLPEVGAIETETFPKLPKNKFIAFKSSDYWRGVDTAKDLEEAAEDVKKIFSA